MRQELRASAPRGAASRCAAHFFWAMVFSIFVNILMLTGPLFMLQVYDRVLTSRSEETLVALTLLVTGLFAIMGILDFIRGRVLARAGARIQSSLDDEVMTAVLRRSVSPAERALPSTGPQELAGIRQWLASPAPFAFFDIPWTPFFLAAIFVFHPLLGWVATGGGVTLIALAVVNQFHSRGPSARAYRFNREAESLGEALRQNAESVRALGMKRAGVDRWLQLRRDGLAGQIVGSDRAASYMVASKSLRFYLQALILAVGAWLVLEQKISAGMMIAASILLGRALAPVEQMIGQWETARRALRGWRAISELLEKTPPEQIKTALPVPRGDVDVQGISVREPDGGRYLLRNVSFSVQPGMVLGVIGPSGAGKTTLAKALAGVWRPVAGSIRIDGAEIDQWAEDELGRHIGYLPQEVGLINGTVAENIARMAREPDDAEIVAAAQLAGAHRLFLSFPQGYDTRIGAEGRCLSGGQRQRVALARALYGDPPILILDEPNANLDADGERAMTDAIRKAKARGRTVIVMVHRPSAIAACDLLLMLHSGQQTDFGPRDEVLGRGRRIDQEVGSSVRAGSARPANVASIEDSPIIEGVGA